MTLTIVSTHRSARLRSAIAKLRSAQSPRAYINSLSFLHNPVMVSHTVLTVILLIRTPKMIPLSLGEPPNALPKKSARQLRPWVDPKVEPGNPASLSRKPEWLLQELFAFGGLGITVLNLGFRYH